MVETLHWTLAAALNELPDGGLKNCDLNGRSVVLSHCGGRYGAIDGRCPHMGGPLGEGEIIDGLLVCPWHGREYDPVSGECGLGEHAQSFPVELRQDGVYVGLPDMPSSRT
jgi:pyruvate oxidase